MSAPGAIGAVCVVLVMVLGFTGCSSSESGRDSAAEPETDPAPTSTPATPTSSTTPTGSELSAAQDALDAAIGVMAREPVTAFDATTSAQDVDLLTAVGTVAADGWTSEVTFTSPDDEPSVMLVRGDRSHVWMQLRDWPAPRTGCWLDLGLTQAPVGVQALAGGEPGYLSILGALDAVRVVPGTTDQMVATLPIHYATVLFTSPISQELDLSAVPDDARVEVELRVGPRVASLQLSGQTYLQALEAAGGSASEKGAAAVRLLSVAITYPDPPGRVPPFEAPDPELVIAGEEALQAGC